MDRSCANNESLGAGEGGKIVRIAELSIDPGWNIRNGHSQIFAAGVTAGWNREAADNLERTVEDTISIIEESLRRIQQEGGRGNFVIFTVDEQKNYYIQISAVCGQPTFSAEAVSNTFLNPEFALDDRQIERLKALGWQANPGHNFFRDDWQAFDVVERTEIAEEVMRTLIEVYVWQPDQPLEIDLVLE